MLAITGTLGGPHAPTGVVGADTALVLASMDLSAAGGLLVGLVATAALVLLSCRERRRRSGESLGLAGEALGWVPRPARPALCDPAHP